MRPRTRPMTKPSTAAIRANFTTRPITLRTTKTTTARMSATITSSARMDLIRDLGDFLSHLGVTGIHRAVTHVGGCLAGTAHNNIGDPLLAGGLGWSLGLFFVLPGIAHGQGNASGGKLCRGMQALHSAIGR